MFNGSIVEVIVIVVLDELHIRRNNLSNMFCCCCLFSCCVFSFRFDSDFECRPPRKNSAQAVSVSITRHWRSAESLSIDLVKENVNHSLDHKATSSNPTNSPKLKLTILKERQQIVTFKKLEPAGIFTIILFRSTNRLIYWSLAFNILERL